MSVISTIIVAAGSGKRLGSATPKQYLELGGHGKVILMHTIDAFKKCSNEIIVVVPKGGAEQWDEICQKYSYTTKHKVVEGAEERFFSVQNGLKEIAKDSDIVLVQDGVRPFVSQELIERVIEATLHYDAVVPAVPVVDTLRRVSGGVVSRSEFMAVQTPQGFNRELLDRAYKQPYQKEFTDDGSVVEAIGGVVEMVEGDVENFKITTQLDYKLSQLIIHNS